jgi:Clp amino terminal domain, pathogenicity island component
MAETLTMTPRCTAILGAAAEIVRAMGHTYIGVENLFLALAHDADAVPTQVLAEFVSVGDVEPARAHDEAWLHDAVATDATPGAVSVTRLAGTPLMARR